MIDRFEKYLRNGAIIPLDIIRDSHTIPGTCPNPGIISQIKQTFRYRLTNYQLSITENERDLLKLKNLHEGERAVIIGNGPSLNLCDLKKLKNEITFGVNSIFLNYEIMGFHPTYYIVEDVFVAEDRAQEINQYSGPKMKFFGNYLRYCIDEADDILWLNVRFRYEDYPNFPYFSRNAARMVWTGGTVSYICLQLAFYMGFNEVYLIGFDHSYNIPSDANVAGTTIVSQSDDPNHFNPNYFGKGYRWHDPKVQRMEQAYRKAKKIFEIDGRKIFNATKGGKLEVFERIEYDDIF